MLARFVVLILALVLPVLLQASDWNRVVDLRGTWKFEIGDDLKWADPNFDDSGWEAIFVPFSWEDEGFPGYDGFAWYRKRFTLSPEFSDKTIYLLLGYIDDADEVFLNGHFVGFSGGLPPDYLTAYQQSREYILPKEFLKFSGENVIAVRVYDEQLEGGIVRGQIGLFEQRNALNPDVALAGLWRFTTGDDMDWKEPDFDDSDWQQLLVPLRWETQGYEGYDGFAWYRKKFRLNKNLGSEKLILLLGKIDDLDETYLNGERIGRTGRIYRFSERVNIRGDEWLELRAYYIPSEYLNLDGENVIAVRVYDGLISGGIYDGPVGIVTQDRYRQWFRKYGRKHETIWEIFDF